MSPSYTIILPVHNGMANGYLPACVASILAQTYTDFELAVLENASTDGSAEWLAQQKDSRIRYYPEPQPLSFNENWSRSSIIPRADWMTFIGQDDLLAQTYLEEIDRIIKTDPEIDLVNNRYRTIDATGDIGGEVVSAADAAGKLRPAVENSMDYVRGRFSRARDGWVGSMMRTEIFDALGGWPQFEGGMCSDCALALLLGAKSRKVANSSDALFLERSHDGSASKRFPTARLGYPLCEYFVRLARFAETNSDFATALNSEGRTYCIWRAQQMYRHMLILESKANRALPASVLEDLKAGLEFVAPHAGNEIIAPVDIQRYSRINSSALNRLLYNTYTKIRDKIRSWSSPNEVRKEIYAAHPSQGLASTGAHGRRNGVRSVSL